MSADGGAVVQADYEQEAAASTGGTRRLSEFAIEPAMSARGRVDVAVLSRTLMASEPRTPLI
jgi:hypothetical protein